MYSDKAIIHFPKLSKESRDEISKCMIEIPTKAGEIFNCGSFDESKYEAIRSYGSMLTRLNAALQRTCKRKKPGMREYVEYAMRETRSDDLLFPSENFDLYIKFFIQQVAEVISGENVGRRINFEFFIKLNDTYKYILFNREYPTPSSDKILYQFVYNKFRYYNDNKVGKDKTTYYWIEQLPHWSWDVYPGKIMKFEEDKKFFIKYFNQNNRKPLKNEDVYRRYMRHRQKNIAKS